MPLIPNEATSMHVRISHKARMILFIAVLLVIIAYQASYDKYKPSGENSATQSVLNTPIAERDPADKNLHSTQSQYPPETEIDITPGRQRNTTDPQVAEPNDITYDTNHAEIRLPSEQIYSQEYRDALISSFRNGTMTYSQKRDFDRALNHPLIPTEDKILLNNEFMFAFQQRKITPEQIFSQWQ